LDLVAGECLFSGTAECDLEELSGKSCASAAKKNVPSWLRNEERWNPELANIFGVAARYRRATIGSSHDEAHPDKSALHTGKIYSFSLHISRFIHLLLRQRRGAAVTTWPPR
jgi:hypothetical protein